MAQDIIRVQITIHKQDLVYPEIADLQDNLPALRRRIHTFIHNGVLATQNIPQSKQAFQVTAIELSPATSTKAPSHKKRKAVVETDEVSFEVPEFDLGGLPG